MVGMEARPLAKDLDEMDREASLFAMELLMPYDFLMADLEKAGGVDLEDDYAVGKLAKKYKVSHSVMAICLGMLIAERGRKS